MRLKLDFKQWRCSRYLSARPDCRLGQEHVRLFNPDAGDYHNSCCLGLMLQAAGMPRQKMSHMGMPGAVLRQDSHLTTPELRELRSLLTKLDSPQLQVQCDPVSSQLAEAASLINDDGVDTPVYERLARLTRLFQERGVELVWFNVPEGIAHACMEFAQKAFKVPLPTSSILCSKLDNA